MSAPVLLITGASNGVGAATARLAVSGGRRVVLLARSRERLDALAAELGGENVALPVAGDVRDWEDQQRAVALALERFGRLDAAFACAGVGGGRDFLDDTVEQWREQVDVNLLGVCLTIRATLAALRDARGHLLICSSVSGRLPLPTVYAASKWALTGLGLGLRRQLAEQGVRMTLVEPGLIDTAFHDVTGVSARAISDEIGVETPLTAGDVARAVLFALDQPAHVAINDLSLRPATQLE